MFNEFTWKVLGEIVCVVVVNRNAQIVKLRIRFEVVGQIVGDVYNMVNAVSKIKQIYESTGHKNLLF